MTALLLLLPSISATATTSSLLSAGRWVKVHTDTTSVYRLPHSLLREWGFDNPDNIVIAGYGSVERAHSLDTAPDDLPVLPVYRDATPYTSMPRATRALLSTPFPGADTPLLTPITTITPKAHIIS